MPGVENGEYTLAFYQKLLTHVTLSFLLSRSTLDAFCIIGLIVFSQSALKGNGGSCSPYFAIANPWRKDLSDLFPKGNKEQDFSEHPSLVSTLQLSFKP